MYRLYPWGCVDGLICHKGFLEKRGGVELHHTDKSNNVSKLFVCMFVC